MPAVRQPSERRQATLFLPCAAGVEQYLADECRQLLDAGTGASSGVGSGAGKGEGPGKGTVTSPTLLQAARGGVTVLGDEAAAMRLNLGSRLAQRVLWRLAEGPYRSEHDLYALARTVPWCEWITPRQTLRVDTTAQRSPLQSLNFATLRIKDAVCDVLRDATGERPSVDTRHPDLPLLLHLGPERASLYVDTSGEALFKRGWRDANADKGEAPLKETLAAAMLAAAGWQGRAEDGPLLDPCCGAGTIAIEAAQLACGMAPGLQRRYAFERLAPFRPHMAAWRDMQQAARDAVHAPAVQVYAGDVAFRMTDFAVRNAQRAGVAHAIEFKAADALQRPPPAPLGTMMLNPPYGERIAPKGSGQEPAASREAFDGGGSSATFYAGLASHWKRQYAGWTAWVLSPDAKLPSLLRLKESRRIPMWNGPIECRLFRIDLITGSARVPRAASSEPGVPTVDG